MADILKFDFAVNQHDKVDLLNHMQVFLDMLLEYQSNETHTKTIHRQHNLILICLLA